MRCACWPPAYSTRAPNPAQRRGPGTCTRRVPTFLKTPAIATPTGTPKYTAPATEGKEKQNEEEVKDKPSGKKVKIQKK
ncbi:hypothetical protein [Hymenobacter nivis]|uniref:hypothetical protein n=1 Tax=Hymenobacter nivis TaxID=1850093 RepID=UPI0013A5BAC1|nr:hypothetical protein [Hymenobacter nivis]